MTKKGLFSVKEVLVGILMVLFLGSMSSCNLDQQKKEDTTIRMAYANWSEGVAMTFLASEILKEDLGYDVITKMSDVESVFELLNSGNYDVFVDAWLPQTHGHYMDKYGPDLEDLGVNVKEVQTGLMVPDYMGIDNISDLAGQDTEIIGIGEEAGIMKSTRSAIDRYALSVTLTTGSESTMTERLSEAIKKREPIVITGWTPHWINNRYDLKFLGDPEHVFGESEQIHTIARNGFTNQHSRASLFFERFELTPKQLGSLMDEFETLPDNEERAVQNWIKKHQFVVNRWTRGLRPEREKVM